ncbi:hypothetical protein GN956_G949 [Arapaima gigas]
MHRCKNNSGERGNRPLSVQPVVGGSHSGPQAYREDICYLPVCQCRAPQMMEMAQIRKSTKLKGCVADFRK